MEIVNQSSCNDYWMITVFTIIENLSMFHLIFIMILSLEIIYF